MTLISSRLRDQRSPLSLTAEIYTIPYSDDAFVVYAPLRRAAFVANSSMVNKLVDIMEGSFTPEYPEDSALVQFLERLELVNGGPEPDPTRVFSGPPVPTQVSLFLTTACNLRCAYCYASAGDRPARFMKLETAARAIDFVARNAADQRAGSFEVIYHGGGEPTTHWRVLTASLEYARGLAARLDLGLRASLGTNGVLSEEQLYWVVHNLEGLTLSFDGLPEAHDANRRTVQGGPSSEAVMTSMRYLDKSEFNYGIRMTVTADQLERLPDSVEFICSNFRPATIQVEPCYQLGRWRNAPSAETLDFVRLFREASARAAPYARPLVFSAVRLDTLTSHYCAVSQDSFGVTPEGRVSACFEVFSPDQPWSDVFFYGRESAIETNGYDFDLNALDRLRNGVVATRSFCSGCFARWHCAGDCPHKALSVLGDGPFSGTDRCHITRELTKDALITRIAESGGLFWNGVGPRPEPYKKELSL